MSRTKPEAKTAEPPRARRSWLPDVLLILAAALLIWLSFPPANLGPAAWIALVPLLIVVARAPLKRALLLTGLGGWLFFLVSLYWLWYVTIAGWIALAFYCALYWPLAVWLLRVGHRNRIPFAFLAPVVFATLEFARANLFTGFPFILIGHTQTKFLPLIQIADITGVYGITFLLAMVNGLIADLILCRLRLRKPQIAAVASTIILVAAVCGYGVIRLDQLEKTDPPTRRIFLVQGNVPIHLKHSPTTEDHLASLQRHVDLSLRAKGEAVDLLIWPETMVPAVLNMSLDPEILLRAQTTEGYENVGRLMAASAKAVRRVPVETGANMLVGAETQLFRPEAVKAEDRISRHNSAYLFSAEAQELGRYDKIHLVVFGEYTPLARVFPFLRGLRPAVMGPDLQPGAERQLFDLPDGTDPATFGVTICYEDSVADLFRRFVQDGSDFMVNITNDGWFRNSPELDIHFAICAMRAVENHVSIARCANTGISGFIAPTGQVLDVIQTPEGRRREIEGTLMADLPVHSSPGFYTRFGDLFAWLCFILLLLSTAGPALHRRVRRAGHAAEADHS